jgi:hypothetical protein
MYHLSGPRVLEGKDCSMEVKRVEVSSRVGVVCLDSLHPFDMLFLSSMYTGFQSRDMIMCRSMYRNSMIAKHSVE